jgi:hypothetical protein
MYVQYRSINGFLWAWVRVLVLVLVLELVLDHEMMGLLLK